MARVKVEISEEQYLEAIELLENKGTKKKACEVLGIAYNTKRLDTLIDAFNSKREATKRLRAKKRTQAVDSVELVQIIVDYLNGYSLQELSERYYRSVGAIKYQLEKHGAMLRHNGKIDQLNPPLMPDACVAEEFKDGQLVWSAKYGTIAQVICKYKNAYRIQVFGHGIQEFSYQPAWELGDLTHLEELGVDLTKFQDYIKTPEIHQAIHDARKAAKKSKQRN